jgi:hypothetical protein
MVTRDPLHLNRVLRGELDVLILEIPPRPEMRGDGFLLRLDGQMHTLGHPLHRRADVDAHHFTGDGPPFLPEPHLFPLGRVAGAMVRQGRLPDLGLAEHNLLPFQR